MQKFVKSFQEFTEKLEKDPVLQQDFKDDPVKASKTISPTPLDSDNWIYRVVVISLGLVSLSVVIGSIILLCIEKKPLSSGIIAIGSASIGALAGLLAPSPKSN